MWLLRAVAWLVCQLPPRAAFLLSRGLGDLLRVSRLRRTVVERNVRGALGLDGEAARPLVRGVYRHLGALIVEYLRLPRLLDAARARAILGEHNIARLESLLRQGRGLVVVSAHVGNWDLLACAAAACGLPVNVVTRRIKQRALHRYWWRMRARYGLRQLNADGCAKEIVAALDRGEIVAMVLDQHQPGGVVVPFFQAAAATSTAAARLARLRGAPLVPAFLLRHSDGYHFELGPQIEPAQTLVDTTARCTQAIEAVIRRFPEQWFWVHRRWKAEPSWPIRRLP